MKRILSLVFVSMLATLSVSAQQGAGRIDPGSGIRPGGVGTNSAPPVTNPEPITLVALAGGAAAAGGLLRRRKQAKK
jgi:hypothetical protein